MSITPQDPPSARAADPAERALFRRAGRRRRGLPARLAPLPRAVARAPRPPVRARRPTWSARCSCPPRRRPELLAVPPGATPLDVVLVARPGTAARRGRARPLDRLARRRHARGRRRSSRLVRRVARGRWRWGLPVSVEVPRGPDQARGARATSATPTAGKSPLSGQVPHRRHRPAGRARTRPSSAAFLARCVDTACASSSPAACTTPSRTPPPTGEDQHGLPQRPLRHPLGARPGRGGAGAREALLAERDPAPWSTSLTGMSHADAGVVRAFFTAYGCCGVTDPVARPVEPWA